MLFARTLCALTLLCLCQAASAQAYKCTTNGTTTYQDKPCADGKGTTLDLPGAYLPPGALDVDSPEGTALALNYMRLMVKGCPLSRSTSDRADQLVSRQAPSIKSLSNAQWEAVSAKAAHYAANSLTPQRRAAQCKAMDDAINSNFQAHAAGTNKPPTPAAPAPGQKPTPTL